MRVHGGVRFADGRLGRHGVGVGERPGVLLALVLVTAVFGFVTSVTPAMARYGGSGVVTPSRIGPLELGVSTADDVRAFAGRPMAVFASDMHSGGQAEVWGYDCGERKCLTVYSFDPNGATVSGWVSFSRDFQTRAGTRVGTSRARARAREKRPITPSCTGAGALSKRGAALNSLVIGFNSRRATSLQVAGPRAPMYFSC